MILLLVWSVAAVTVALSLLTLRIERWYSREEDFWVAARWTPAPLLHWACTHPPTPAEIVRGWKSPTERVKGSA